MGFKETEVGRIPEEWEVKELGDIGEVISGGTPKTKVEEYWNGKISWITPKDLSGFSDRYIYKGERMITELGLQESSAKLLPTGTILFSSRAPIGYVAIAGKEMSTNQGFKNIVCYEDIVDNVFLYYLMKYRTEDIEKIAGGSTFKEVSGKVIKAFKVQLPPLKEQKAIAQILSTLDEKIETNNKINKNLETMASEIFKHWFVDFEFPDENGNSYKSSGGVMVESEMGLIPEGWEVIELNEIANLTMGLSPKSDSYNLEQVGIPLLNGAADFENGLISSKKYTSSPTRVCKKNDLVFCIRATIGNITFADKEYCLGRGVAAISPINDEFTGLIYYNLLMSINELISNATGSVILGLSKPDINNMKLVLPDKKILKHFSNISNNILKDKQNNEIETKIITNLRNTLLPKLMSGELRVPTEN